MKALPALLLLLPLAACSRGEESGRAADSTHAPDRQASRLCSLSLAGDELLALLVPPERVSCVSTFVDDPELSNVAGRYPRSIPRLAGRIEPVLAARPDIVIVAPWNDPTFVETLGRTGVHTYVLPDAETFPAIRAMLVDFGAQVGETARAGELARTMDQRLADLDRRLDGIAARPRVLSFSHLIVAGEGTTVDALIRRAGGRNAAADLHVTGHQQVPLEQIIAIDPDWLLLGFDPGEKRETLLDAYPLLKKTRAAREGRILVMPPRRLTTVSPFLVDGAVELARTLHPDRFRDAAPKAP